MSATSRDGSEQGHKDAVERLRKELDKGLTMTASDGTVFPFDGTLLVDGVAVREKVRVKGDRHAQCGICNSIY